MRRLAGSFAVVLLSGATAVAMEALPGEAELRPYLEKYCFECHGISDEASDLNLLRMVEEPGSWVRHQDVLADVLWVVEESEMPPAKHPVQPRTEEQEEAVLRLQGMVDAIATGRRDDPGQVVMPRLTKAEYNRVIRDLTGLDLKPARFLPNDSLAGEGFANVGEAQGTTVGEIERYLGAAALVMQHLHASPKTGLNWFPAPLAEATTRDELIDRIIRQIGDWYADQQHAYVQTHVEALKAEYEFPHGPYLLAAWEYRYRDALGRPEETLREVALRSTPTLRPEILENWWNLLHAGEELSVQLAHGVADWQALPGPGSISREALEGEVAEILEQWRHIHRYYSLSHRVGEKSKVPDIKDRLREGVHPFFIDLLENRKQAPEFVYLLTTDALEANPADLALWKNLRFTLADGSTRDVRPGDPIQELDGSGEVLREVRFGVHPDGLEIGPEILAVRAPALLRISVPDGAVTFEAEAHVDERIDGDQSIQTVVRTEPLERPEQLRWHPGTHSWAKKDNRSQSRVYAEYYAARNGLIARGHKIEAGASLEGPLIAPRLEIDPEYLGGPWKKQKPLRTDLHNPYLLDLHHLEEQIASRQEQEGLSRLFVQLQEAAAPLAQDREALRTRHADTPLEDWPAEERQRFERLTEQLGKQQAEERVAAADLLRDWLGRAWRRPVGDDELAAFLELYDREREGGMLFSSALEVPMIASLVSPYFLYRHQEAKGHSEAYALSDDELANRLSFFLWGSLPDPELQQLAREGKLRDPDVLLAQARRMIHDPRIDYLAVEFAGRWLQFAGFEEFSGPDLDRFPEFTPELREAMYEEARLFFVNLFQQDRPVTEILSADYTFANERLATHYGIKGVDGDAMRMVRVGNAPRGGVLGMGAVLTRYSEPLRTSPVRRGHWIYENLMGYPMPEPPPNVPMISQDDVGESGISVRDELVQHREDPGCASCHNKIDPLGIALENLDPIGAWREVDSADQPVLAEEVTHDGVPLRGVRDLQAYLREHRADFLQNFCEKLLGFALGRAVVLSDTPLLEKMRRSLEENDYRFLAALDPILTSPQFLQRRDEPVADPTLSRTTIDP